MYRSTRARTIILSCSTIILPCCTTLLLCSSTITTTGNATGESCWPADQCSTHLGELICVSRLRRIYVGAKGRSSRRRGTMVPYRLAYALRTHYGVAHSNAGTQCTTTPLFLPSQNFIAPWLPLPPVKTTYRMRFW